MPPLAPSHHTAERPSWSQCAEGMKIQRKSNIYYGSLPFFFFFGNDRTDPDLSRGNGIVYLLDKPFFSLFMSGIVVEGSTLTPASRSGGGHSGVGFENFRQMRATLRVFLRMEQMGLESNTQVISICRRRHDMTSSGGVAWHAQNYRRPSDTTDTQVDLTETSDDIFILCKTNPTEMYLPAGGVGGGTGSGSSSSSNRRPGGTPISSIVDESGPDAFEDEGMNLFSQASTRRKMTSVRGPQRGEARGALPM